MRVYWLATTAVALVLGTGAVIAQSQPDQKRDDTPRTQQSPTKKDDGRSDGQQGRSTTPVERKQTQDHQPASTAQESNKQKQDRKANGDRSPSAQDQDRNDRPSSKQSQQRQGEGRDTKETETKQQGQGQARDAKQPAEQNQQRDRAGQPKQNNQARDTKQSGDQKQQTGRQGSAEQPATTTQQGTAPSNDKNGQTTDQSTTESSRTGGLTANTNERQRTAIVDRLRRDRSVSNRNINIDVSVGVRLPSRARVRPLPQDIVRIMPQYRGYQYTVIEDEVVLVEPRTRKVVEVLRDGGSTSSVRSTSRSESPRISLSNEQREILKQSALRMTTAQTSGGSGSLSDTSCVQLQAVPDEVVRSNPELRSYRVLAIGQQVVLVDPRDQKIVEVIE